MEKNFYTLIEHDFGLSLLAWSNKGITKHFFDSKEPEKYLLKKQTLVDYSFVDLKSSYLNIPVDIRKAISYLKNYFNGTTKKACDPNWIDWTLFGEFQYTVYQSLIKVESGNTLSYKDLAKKIRKPLAARAVGTAMRRNPLPIFIPCHRVVKSDGSLGNFSSERGVTTKVELLYAEKNKLSLRAY